MDTRIGSRGLNTALLAGLGCLAHGGEALAQQVYDSGSTGRDGALNVDVNTDLPLPPDGVLHYTTITIAPGAVLRILPNADNTPAYLLATGDVVISGSIEATPVALPAVLGNGVLTRDLLVVGAVGGPGGHAGGSVGHFDGSLELRTSAGLGPGRGLGGTGASPDPVGGASPVHPAVRPPADCDPLLAAAPGPALADWFQLSGGSGGGGTPASPTAYMGGGAGGGVLTIATSGTLTVTGSISVSNMRNDGNVFGGSGGGGALRLVGESILGGGATTRADSVNVIGNGCGNGGRGFVRLEAFSITGGIEGGADVTSLPGPSLPFAEEQRPILHIVTIDGRPAIAPPPGQHPHFLPGATVTPDAQVIVELEARNVPPGSVATVVVNSLGAPPADFQSTPFVGDASRSTARATVQVPAGVRLGDIQAYIAQTPVARFR